MLCGTCGIPLGISRGNTWRADGTISGRYKPYMKGTFFDVDELGFLFDSLSELMHYDVGDIVASGKYHDTREYMAALTARMKEESSGELPPPEELYRAMLYPVSIWGIAEVEFLSMQPEKMTIRVMNPYSISLLRGDVAGVADVVMGRSHKAVWEGGRDEGLMHIFPVEEHTGLGGRIDEVPQYDEEPGMEELACERCEACGAPTGAADLFGWDEKGCRIEERSTGRRYCFNNTRGITAVLSMLVHELGGGIEDRMVETSREYARALYGEGAAEADDGSGAARFDLDAELESFPYRGWGRAADVSMQGEELSLRIENPYNDILIAGRIWGLQESACGRTLGIAHRAGEGRSLQLAYGPA